ncbi:MAG: antibiotic biosynthesis monooxygenase family protein [Chloroflexota bacterium]|nr:MAG: antibiotic biosynthesis monooxygenase [Chloroflexota bacterium]
MVIEIAVITIVPGQEKDFEVAFEKARAYLAASPGCLSYQLTRCIEHPTRYVLRNEWATLADHTEVFRGSDAYQAYRDLVYPYYGAPPDVLHYHDVG